jgi:hypothetical protein
VDSRHGRDECKTNGRPAAVPNLTFPPKHRGRNDVRLIDDHSFVSCSGIVMLFVFLTGRKNEMEMEMEGYLRTKWKGRGGA